MVMKSSPSLNLTEGQCGAECGHSGHLMELYEIVLNTLKESDPKAAFLRNTVGASMREYYARLEEVYSGSRTDPEFWGEAKALP